MDVPSLQEDGRVSRVAQLLRTEIVRGAVEPGAQLRIGPLAEQLGTSKGTVREAIRELVSQGLLEHRLHRGTFVRQFSDDDCRDLFIAREVIETWAASQIVSADERPDVTKLETAVKRMAHADDPNDVVDADMDFHREIVKLAGVARLVDMHESIIVETVVMVRSFHPVVRDDCERVHRELLRGLVGRDIDTPDLLAQHLQSASERIMANLHRVEDHSA